jgi:putative membrane protein
VKVAVYVGALAGLLLLMAVGIRADLAGILQTLRSAGYPLLWLVPYRGLFFLLYALGWRALLRPSDADRLAGLGYLWWATSVRDAIDRLLPVASVGGSVVGIRLLRFRGVPAAPAGASVIVEIVLTLIVVYLFTAIGLIALRELSATSHDYRRMLLAFALSSPVPLATVWLLRYGSVFERAQRFLHALLGAGVAPESWAPLDHELRAALRRTGPLFRAGTLQFAAMISGCFEVWFALRLFGHPVGAGTALVLESMTQAVRHLAFVVPAGIGVQEAGLMLVGHALGVDGELALAVSMAKRMREVLCGLPSLISWQYLEGRRIQEAANSG